MRPTRRRGRCRSCFASPRAASSPRAFSRARPSTPPRCCASRTISTPCNWAKSLGGLKALFARADANAKAIADWVERTPWIDFLARAPETRSNTSVCLKVVDPAVAALPADAQAAIRESGRQFPREGKGRVRHRRLSRRAAWPAHLVRCDGRNGRRRGSDALARLRLRYRKEQARQSGLSEALSPPRKRGSRVAASGLALMPAFAGMTQTSGFPCHFRGRSAAIPGQPS